MIDWLKRLWKRWKTRNWELACAFCRQAASEETFKKGRYMILGEKLFCEKCGETSDITTWRSQGFMNYLKKQNEQAANSMKR